MTDIVERPRQLVCIYENKRGAYGQELIALREAADVIEAMREHKKQREELIIDQQNEIERLRAALQGIEKLLR
jgi:hypothetical protein